MRASAPAFMRTCRLSVNSAAFHRPAAFPAVWCGQGKSAAEFSRLRFFCAAGSSMRLKRLPPGGGSVGPELFIQRAVDEGDDLGAGAGRVGGEGSGARAEGYAPAGGPDDSAAVICSGRDVEEAAVPVCRR